MPTALRRLFVPLLILLLTLTAGCPRAPDEHASKRAGEVLSGKWQERGEDRRSEWVPEVQGEYPLSAFRNWTETGDLGAIKRRGKLRILVDISNVETLPRAATQQDIEIDQARRLAERLGLEPVVLYVDSFDQLIPLLIEGKGDIIANDLTITPERQQLVDFSLPTVTSRLVLVSREDVDEVKTDDPLTGKTLTVTRGTTYETMARELVKQHPGLELEVVDTNYVELTVDVATGKIDFTIIDEFILDLVRQFRDDIKVNMAFPEPQVLGWAIRQDSPELMKEVNDMVRHLALTETAERFTGDLDGIKRRGFIRAVTRNTAASYFMWKGRILGYEFELLEEFAKQLGVRLEIIVAPGHDEFIRYLNEGRADIAAALLSITERRREQGVEFSVPYLDSGVGIVARAGDKIEKLEDLSGRTIYVREASSHYEDFQRLQQKVPGVKLELVPDEMNIYEIIDKVANGEYDLAIADDVTIRSELTWRDDIELALDLETDNNKYGWMMRNTNPQLLEAANEFFTSRKTRSTLSNLYKKYFESPKHTRPEITKLTRRGHISPYDKLVQKYAEEYDFDWRLVTAQMFQESSFNPRAKSWAGALGLMQVMPDTGKQMGETNLFDPETSVRTGIRYLNWLHEKFVNREGISPENRMWFTLAAYNAGLGHVYDAKDLAEEMGWDRKVWFGNVERAMLLLSERKYYSKARYGYARGAEPVEYVRKIEARFRTYVALLDAFERRQREAASLLFGSPLLDQLLAVQPAEELPAGTAGSQGRGAP